MTDRGQGWHPEAMVEGGGIERRRFPRVSLSGAEHRIRFQVQGSSVEGVRIVNLSAGGCGLEVPMVQAMGLEVGTVLEGFYVEHPEVPHLPLPATVVRVLGKVPGKTSGYVLVGVEFPDLTPIVQGLLAAHVERLLNG